VYEGDSIQYAAGFGLVAFVHFLRVCDGCVGAVKIMVW